MADLQISALPPLAGALLQGVDAFPAADISASETKKITALDLATGLARLFPAGSIPGTAVNLTIAPGSITTALLANKSVTAAKLNDQSSAVVSGALPANGAYIGQLGYSSTDATLRIWDGSTWQALKAAGSINTLAYDNSAGPVALAGAVTGDSVTLSARLSSTTAAAQFLAGPSGAGGAVSYRAITGADLPTAGATAKGGVQVSGAGLRMNGSLLEIANDITATGGAYGLVDVNAKGLVLGTRPIGVTDLPLATAGTVGVVMPGSDLVVTAGGVLNHEVKVAGGGTFTKLTVNSTGHVTAGTSLTATDIPDLPAEKLVSGSLNAALLADRSIPQTKLSDYAIAFIQEASPPSSNTYHNGMLWFQESTGQLRMWNGNSWFPVGAGRLTAENLRYCGIFDGATGVITGVTQFGTAEGFKVGDLVPPATDARAGIYLVCGNPGAGTAEATGVNFDAGDWVLCNGAAAGWTRIDTLNGAAGGGGGGTSNVNYLDDLLDVTLTGPADGNGLRYNAAGQWVNVRTFSTGTTAPANPVAGQFFLDTTVSTAPVLKVYSGSAWVGAGGGGVASGGTAPASPAVGDTWVNTGTTPPTLGIWDGNKWVTVAPIDSPAFTGTPTAPTAAAGTNTTQVATTEFVQAAQLLSKTGTTLSAKTSGDLLAPAILPAATDAAQGAVRLATAADVTAGTTGRVVTADQLKTTNDAITTAAGGGVPDAPDGTADGTVQYARQVVSAGTTHTKSWAPVLASVWKRAGTTLSPATTGDVVQISAGTAALPGLTPAGDPDTGLWSPGANQLAISTGGLEVLRVTDSNEVLFGARTARVLGGGGAIVPEIQIEGNSPAWPVSVSLVANHDGPMGPMVFLGKTRGTTLGSIDTVLEGDNLGIVLFNGANVSGIENTAAFFGCFVDGTPTANTVKGRLEFHTTDDASSPVERLRITSDGVIKPMNGAVIEGYLKSDISQLPALP